MKTAVVIGAGFGGLAAAALLAKHDYQVTVLEKNDSPGGRAMVWKQDGFTFDMGPSWYQMPSAFERFFGHFGKSPADFYTLHRLDPQYRFFALSDKSETKVYDIYADPAKNYATYERIEPGSPERIQAFLQEAKRQYELAEKYILYETWTPADFLNPFRSIRLAGMNIYEPLKHTVRRYVRHPHLQKMLLYTVLFIGSSPDRLPGMFSMMAHLDAGIGTYYPAGGMGTVVAALVQLGTDHSVSFRFAEPVTRIEVKNGKAVAVHTATGSYPADVVVGNADLAFIETELLEERWQQYPASYWSCCTIAPSAFTAYLGIERRLPDLAHHNLLIADSWEKHFDAIYGNPSVPQHPSYYLSCPTKTDHTVAPQGCENVFITVQLPAGLRLETAEREEYLDHILQHFITVYGVDFRPDIRVRRIFSDQDYVRYYNAYRGTALGLATTFLQSIFRPGVRQKNVRNLFYAGQYTPPGPGVPMCLIAAENAVREILRTNR
ncbi:MAG: phytoene desaturase family protein [Patescibacteria group bacterium]|nr:phytoene desaturase family protein [Patescibacteria group bacterium]